MKINGNLVLNALGQSEIQNFVVERVVSTPAFSASEAGRMVYNTTSREYVMNTGMVWVALATGKDIAAAATVSNAIETSIGSAVDGSGVFNPNAFSANNIVSASSITDAINQLDSAISGKNELGELLDVTLAGLAAGQVLRYDLSTNKWKNHTLTLSDISDITVSAAEVNTLAGVTSNVQAQINSEATARTAGDATNAAAIAAEATARAAAIVAEATARADADAAEVVARSAAVAAEAATRSADDSTELAARVAADAAAAASASNQLSTEVAARLAGDAALGVRADTIQAELNVTQAAAGFSVDGTYVAPEASTYLATATSLKGADVLLDVAISGEAATRTGQFAALASGLANEAQSRIDGDLALQTQLTAFVNAAIGSNEIADQAEAAARIAADIAIKAEIDLTQATIGTAADGSLIPITGTNYLNEVTTVFGGAFILDTQVKLANDAIAAEAAARTTADTNFAASLQAEIVNRTSADDAIQQELNSTQAGAGLETNGAYAKPTGSNYINNATSLKDADFVLDAAIKVAQDATAAVAVTAAANAAAIIAEATRASAAEVVNANAIAAETAARISSDTATTAAQVAEAAARAAADVAGADALAAETTARIAAVAAITSKVGSGYFLYDGSSKTVHVVTHNTGSRYCNVTVIDTATNEQIIPHSVVFDSGTQLTVTFNVSLACKVVVMGLGV